MTTKFNYGKTNRLSLSSCLSTWHNTKCQQTFGKSEVLQHKDDQSAQAIIKTFAHCYLSTVNLLDMYYK